MTTYVTSTGDDRRELQVRREGNAYVVTDADGHEHRVVLEPPGPPGARTAQIGDRLIAFGHSSGAEGPGSHRIVLGGIVHEVELADARQELYRALAPGDAGGGREIVKAPIPGLITEVAVEVGQTVAADQTLLVLYAMKLENEIRATRGGVVKQIHIAPQQAVEKGTPLVELEGEAAS